MLVRYRHFEISLSSPCTGRTQIYTCYRCNYLIVFSDNHIRTPVPRTPLRVDLMAT